MLSQRFPADQPVDARLVFSFSEVVASSAACNTGKAGRIADQDVLDQLDGAAGIQDVDQFWKHLVDCAYAEVTFKGPSNVSLL